MESLDPFYDAQEEKLAREQSRRNSGMRDMLRSRNVSLDEGPTDGKLHEFIEVTAESTHAGPKQSKKALQWMPPFGYPPFENVFLRLHQEMLDFTCWISLTQEEQERRESFLSRLNGVSKTLWPRSKVVPFGSFLTNLSLPSSDVDVSLIHVPVEHEELAEIGCLRKLANRLLEEQQVSFVELRESAKIPILRIKDRIAPFCEIDISLNSEAPQATSKFIIRNAIEKYPQFRPLVLFIKCFLYQRNLADTFTGGVGSYLLSCLVLAFLQQHTMNFQPRLAELTSLGHLLLDFFNFYARDFRVDKEGLSVLRGGSRFPKSSRQFDLPSVAFTSRRSLQFSEALCVESPLEPDLDIGNKVFQWKVVRSALMQARQVLIDEVQQYDPSNGMKSLLAPHLINPSHSLFNRFVAEEGAKTPNCPLFTQTQLQFRNRSEPVVPAPYSDDEIDLDAYEREQRGSKHRRHSDDPYRRMPQDEYEQRQYHDHRNSYNGSRRRDYDSGQSTPSEHSGRKRCRY